MSRSLRVLALSLLLVTSAFGQYGETEAVPQRLSEGWEAIEIESCRAWLKKLSGKEFEGRGTGQPGYRKAAEFVAGEFEKLGLVPVGDKKSYFQWVPFAQIETEPDKSFLRVGRRDLVLKTEDGFLPGFGAGEARGDVVFLRARGDEARVADPELIRGKIVVLQRRNTLRSSLMDDIHAAAPAALLVVSRRRGGSPRPESRLVMAADLRLEGGLSPDAAEKLALATGAGREAVADPEEEGVQVVVGRKPAQIRFAGKRKDIQVPNVIGMIEGSDPKLKDEVVILGSHLDHLGKDRNGVVHPGADDDGSGSTALLATARAFATNPEKPKRSVVFLAVCGEEMGLLGSRYYTDNPVFPIAATVCELQMDMVGRREEGARDDPEDNVDTTHLVGSKRLSQELHEIILDCNRHVGFRFEYDEEDVYTRSDHYNFARLGIPIAFVFSGFHPDYHKPSDTWDKIDFHKLASTARLFYLVAFRVADMERRLRVDSGPFATGAAETGAEGAR